MKAILCISIAGLSFLLLFGCGSSNTQKSVSEQNITVKVKKAFPKSSIISLHKEQRNGIDLFAVEIKEGEDRKSLLYSETGVLIEMIQRMQPSQLPPVIIKSVQKQYPEGIVFMAQKINRGKTIFYQLAVKNGTRKVEMNLDSKGNLVLR